MDSLRERFPVIHIGYLAPYAYEEFAKVDPEHPWTRVAETSYAILRWLYFDQGVEFPPGEGVPPPRERAAPPAGSAQRRRRGFRTRRIPDLLARRGRCELALALRETLHERMLAPFRAAWKEADGRIYDRYRTDGEALSRLEALPLYATLHSLAELEDEPFARELRERKLDVLWSRALAGQDTPNSLHSWLWFDEALSLGEARRFDELLGFLMPFDFRSFWANLTAVPLIACLALFPLAHLARGSRWQRPVQSAFLFAALVVALRYLGWRGTSSLNFVEPLGPFISISLWVAELYCFASVVLLFVQVGLGEPPQAAPHPLRRGFEPSVDVLIPVFREPLEILERTLLAARALNYPRAEVHVLDDGHRDEVRALAERHGASYLLGPRQHAKAGNLNHALAQTRGELVAIFDTDHVPTASFPRRDGPLVRGPAPSASCRRRTTSAMPTSSSTRSGSRVASPTSRTSSTAASSPRATRGRAPSSSAAGPCSAAAPSRRSAASVCSRSRRTSTRASTSTPPAGARCTWTAPWP